MKIYFAGSIRGGRDDQEMYLELIEKLRTYGTVLTEHIGDKSLSNLGEQEVKNDFIYERDMSWVKESDVIVAELTTPSLGVGFEIGQAQAMEKPILGLYRTTEGKRLSAMMSGNSYLQIREYTTLEDIDAILSDYFKK